MGTVLKLTIKNILKKPFRTFMVVFCVMVCSFTALLSFDMSGAIENMIRGVFSSQIGDVDIMASGLDMDLDFLEDENLPKMDYLALSYAE